MLLESLSQKMSGLEPRRAESNERMGPARLYALGVLQLSLVIALLVIYQLINVSGWADFGTTIMTCVLTLVGLYVAIRLAQDAHAERLRRVGVGGRNEP